ncbi:putative short-chain dehydrogenase/reductase [Nocardioides phosphati]|uniref:Short-chain dehydrogenase/reductase n=1 Tax=Nocardioides phosphati TaxID=1867775 RepID=A0ABQ2NBP1_9ACTN|nr:SDR family NAD(P)-dependent oxidoreductase [Nocardioides phosphati]GGO89971.1 putative short-chain dehydrogenase/reductase [Nocardioides phosphati]
MKSLKDKVVVITGAGSGIGQALAVEAAKEGALLAISDVNEVGLAETAGLAKDAGATDVQTARLDVADRAAFQAYAADVVKHFGRVNLVVNNAGVALAGDFVDLTYEDIDWIFGINLHGVVNGSKEFLPHLIESGDGHLVNISSLFGLVSMPGQSAYNATKYAVRGLSEAIREEMLLNKTGVGVTVVHPGGIKTAIARNARVSEKEDQAKTAELFDKYLARTTAESAAKQILKAVKKNKARLLIGLDAHAVHNFGKFTGSHYQDLIALGSGRVMKATKAKH